MLSIWIGRAGAGKSRRVLETMARQRSQRPQVLLVPEHISHEAEVDLCRALGPTASRDAEVLSFQSLGSRVLARTGGLAEFTLDGGGKLLTMRLALQELHSRLKVFGRPSQRAAFLRQLTDLTEEFYAYEITPQALWQQVEAVSYTHLTVPVIDHTVHVADKALLLSQFLHGSCSFLNWPFSTLILYLAVGHNPSTLL